MDQRNRDADDQGLAKALNSQGEHVAPSLAGAKPVERRRRLQEVLVVDLLVLPTAYVGADQCKKDNEDETDQARDRSLLADEAAPNQLAAGEGKGVVLPRFLVRQKFIR